MKNTSVPIHRKSVTKRTGIDKVFRIIGIIIMSLLSLSYVYMYLWLLLNSFRTSGNFIIDSFKLFDFGNFTLDNYKTLFTVQIAGSSRNPVYLHDTIITTVVLVVGQVALAITIPAFTAYIIAKYEFTYLFPTSDIFPTNGITTYLSARQKTKLIIAAGSTTIQRLKIWKEWLPIYSKIYRSKEIRK